MKLPQYYLAIFLLLSALGASAQVMNVQWVDAPDDPFLWATNSVQEVIRTRGFEDSILVNNQMYFSEGGADVLIEKLDNNGQSIRVNHLCASQSVVIAGMDVNDDEELFLMGSFRDSINLSLNGGSYWHYTMDTITRFVVCYNEDMSIKWSTLISASDNALHAEDLIALDNGEVFFAGNYTDTIAFQTAPQSYIHTNPGDHSYAIKLNGNGDLIWWNTDDLLADQFGFQRDLRFKNQQLYYSYSSIERAEMAKLDLQNGSVLWSHIFDLTIHSHVSDNEGNIYITGNFADFDMADFDPGPDTYTLPANSLDVFLLKLDVNGNFVFAKNIITGDMIDTATDITISDKDQLHLTGCIQSDGDFDPSEASFVLDASGFEDVFVATYNFDGDLEWAKIFGGNSNDIGFKIEAPADTLLIYGLFNREVNFDLNNEAYIIESENNGTESSYFLAKYINCPIDGCASASHEVETTNIIIAPNPFINQLYIQTEKDLQNLRVYNLQGQIVFQKPTVQAGESLDLSFLPSGSYTLNVNSQGKRLSSLIIKI